MFNAQVALDRLREVSPEIDDYLDQEMYRGNHENIYIFDPLMLLNYCMPILLKELEQLGINILLDFEEITVSIELVDACCALREFFDKDAFKSAVSRKMEIKKKILTLFQSQDIKVPEYVRVVLDLCREAQIGNRSQLDRITGLDTNLESDVGFVNHITAILNRCYPISPLTEDSIVEQSGFVKNVLGDTLFPLHQRICRAAREAKFDASLIPNSDLYVSTWMNVDDMPKYIWMSNLRPGDLDEKHQPSAELNKRTLAEFHADLSWKQPHQFEFYNQQSVSFDNIIKMVFHDGVVNVVKKKPNDYPTLRYLLQHPDSMSNYDTIKSIVRPEGQALLEHLLYNVFVSVE